MSTGKKRNSPEGFLPEKNTGLNAAEGVNLVTFASALIPVWGLGVVVACTLYSYSRWERNPWNLARQAMISVYAGLIAQLMYAVIGLVVIL